MKDLVKSVLERRVEKIYPNRETLEKLLQHKRVRLYLGIDPTGSQLHLGHTLPLRKLQEFADLGHEAILLIGTGTVLVGDPSQRAEARKKITEDEIQKNIETWKQQAGKIIDFSKVQIKKNGDWLLKLTMKELIEIASNISAVQLFKREMFRERLQRGDTVWAHETLYPLLQGYDSVVLDVDLEIGGTDQTFNMLIGRELMQKMRGKEKCVLTVPMILGTDGKPMSKSSGNCVWLEDSPTEMYGKLMSIPDKLVDSYLDLVTDLPRPELDQAKQLDPLAKKNTLALRVVRMYHGNKEAQKAYQEFKEVFSKGGIPTDTPVWKISGQKVNLPELLTRRGAVKSRSEVRRLISQGAVNLNGKKLSAEELILERGILKIGKRIFIQIE